jgi:pimeloyl-ACP methyl ester carboxylesterase
MFYIIKLTLKRKQSGGKQMKNKVSLLLVISIFASLITPHMAKAETIPDFCVEGTHADSAEYLICVPENWNGSLLIYAHGYVAFNEPVGIPWDQLIFPDGTSLPEIITSLGFAFATTSYSSNGLAVNEGVAEVVDLVNVFKNQYTAPELILLGGASEGGLITTLVIEQYPDIFDGGLATCGPIGDFRSQINYYGDFRIVFDYFFPGILPPSPMDIPVEVIDNWETNYLPAIYTAIQANPRKTAQLFNVTEAPFDNGDPGTIKQTVERLLWYNVFATNDGVLKLGGQPYDNQDRFYTGVKKLRPLNQQIERFAADQVALDTIEASYQTTGDLNVPLVTLHTTGDEVVPYWHETIYYQKIKTNGDESLYTHIPIKRYGHCNFEVVEVLAGFAVLFIKVSGKQLEGVEEIFQDPISLDAYQKITQEYSLTP